jgi:hypothetical protein
MNLYVLTFPKSVGYFEFATSESLLGAKRAIVNQLGLPRDYPADIRLVKSDLDYKEEHTSFQMDPTVAQSLCEDFIFFCEDCRSLITEAVGSYPARIVCIGDDCNALKSKDCDDPNTDGPCHFVVRICTKCFGAHYVENPDVKYLDDCEFENGTDWRGGVGSSCPEETGPSTS